MELLHNVCTSAVGGINDSPSLSKTTEIQCLGLLEPVADGDFHQRSGKKGVKAEEKRSRQRMPDPQRPASILSTAAVFVFNNSSLVPKVLVPTPDNSLTNVWVLRCPLAYH